MSLSPQHLKKGYAIQLRLRNHFEWHRRDVVRCIPTLAQPSYLQIDSEYEVPIQVLVEARDRSDKPLMIWSKHQGGLGELRDHVRHRDLIREREKPTKKQTQEEDGV
jgi:hypothetical protein